MATATEIGRNNRLLWILAVTLFCVTTATVTASASVEVTVSQEDTNNMMHSERTDMPMAQTVNFGNTSYSIYSQQQQQQQDQANRQLIAIQAFGANPSERYPLARCQGDCDLDSQCRGRLICFQRRRYEPVPGCEGGREDRTPSDYCVDPYDMVAPPQLRFIGINPSRTYFPLQECEGDCDSDSDCAPGLVCLQRRSRGLTVPGCGGNDDGLADYCVKRSNDPNPTPYPSPIMNFGLKMYWQNNYRWQEEDFDRRWCMQCRNKNCQYGDKTYINTCSRGLSERYDFVFVNSDDALIRLHGTNLCFERIASNIFLYDCDFSNQRQFWFAQRGNFRGTRFEISPRGMEGHCITQHHHPKWYEEVELGPCSRARDHDTSYWNRY